MKDADTKQRLADGTYQLSLLAWPSANSIPELSTTNNSKQDTITVGTGTAPAPKPVDFALESLTPSPAQFYESTRPFLLQIKVKNVGTDPVDNAQIVVNLANRRTDGSTAQVNQFKEVVFSKPYASPRIAAGEVVTLTTYLEEATGLPVGSYEVRGTLTMGGSVYGKETNLTNNVLAQSYTVIAGARREPTATSPSPATGSSTRAPTTSSQWTRPTSGPIPCTASSMSSSRPR